MQLSVSSESGGGAEEETRTGGCGILVRYMVVWRRLPNEEGQRSTATTTRIHRVGAALCVALATAVTRRSEEQVRRSTRAGEAQSVGRTDYPGLQIHPHTRRGLSDGQLERRRASGAGGGGVLSVWRCVLL